MWGSSRAARLALGVLLSQGCAMLHPPPPPVRGPAVAEGDVLGGAEMARIRCLVLAPFENTTDLSKLGEVATTALFSSIDPELVKVFPIADLRALFRDSRLELPPEGVPPRLALSLAERVAADGVIYGVVEGRAQGSTTDFMVTVRLQAAGGRELLFASASQVQRGPGESVEVALRRTLLISIRPLLLKIGAPGAKSCFDPEIVKRVRELRSPPPVAPPPEPVAVAPAVASEPIAPPLAAAPPPPQQPAAATAPPVEPPPVVAAPEPPPAPAAEPAPPPPPRSPPPARELAAAKVPPRKAGAAPAVSPTLRVAAAKKERVPPKTARQAAWAQRIEDGRSFVLDEVEFAGRTAALIEEKGLVDLSKAMAAVPEARIRIVAYVDGTDDPSADTQASMAQAMALTRRLVALGVDRERIQQEAKGGDAPLMPNFTSRGREKNRRVEVVPVRGE